MACLVAVYGAEFGPWRVGRDRTVVDDPPAAGDCRFISAIARCAQRNEPGQVGVDDAPPLFERQLVERHGRRADAGVVEQQVEPAESLARWRRTTASTDPGSATSAGTT